MPKKHLKTRQMSPTRKIKSRQVISRPVDLKGMNMAHEFDGKKYEKASAHQKEWGSTIISELCLRGSERVLDLGCGDGSLTAQLADLLPQGEVVGIDASQGMIDVANEKKRTNLSFLPKDINHLDFVEEFDLIYSNAALHWIKDHNRLLRNVRCALRDGGVIRFNFAGDGNCFNFFKVVREGMSQGKFRKYFQEFKWPWHMPSITEYSATVEQSGLRNAKVWGENADRYFKDKETMVNWVDQPSLVPFLSVVADVDKSNFRDYVVRRMIEEAIQEDGRCFETFRRINVVAKK